VSASTGLQLYYEISNDNLKLHSTANIVYDVPKDENTGLPLATPKPTPPPPGSGGGYHLWNFQALNEGETTITFWYAALGNKEERKQSEIQYKMRILPRPEQIIQSETKVAGNE
jgi:predicted secreted protein